MDVMAVAYDATQHNVNWVAPVVGQLRDLKEETIEMARVLYPLKITPDGLWHLPRACKLEKQALKKPLQRKDFLDIKEGNVRFNIEVYREPIESMSYCHMVRAMINRHCMRKTAGMELLIRLFGMMYHKIEDLGGHPTITSTWRLIVVRIWESVLLLYAQGIECFWREYGYDPMIQLMIQYLWRCGLVSVNIQGNKYQTMRGSGVLRFYRYQGFRRAVNESGVVMHTYVYPLYENNEFISIIMNLIPYRYHRVMRLVCKQAYCMAGDKFGREPRFEQEYRMYRAIDKQPMWVCDHSKIGVFADPESCEYCVLMRNRYAQAFPEWERCFCAREFRICTRDMVQCYNYLPRVMRVEDFSKIIDPYLFHLEGPMTFGILSFLLIYMGYQWEYAKIMMVEAPRDVMILLLTT
jgi:hypothetical protein